MFVSDTFNVIIEQGEDGYLLAEVVGLPGCRTQAKTLDELLARAREAIGLYLEVKGPPAVLPKFLGLQQVQVEA